MDFYEERKWKKAIGAINAHNAKKIIEKKDNKYIENLYKKFYSIYLAISYNFNILENGRLKNKLNDYLKRNFFNNISTTTNLLNNLKKKIQNIENKLKLSRNYDKNKIGKLSEIISLIIENINTQEKKINEIYKNNFNIYNNSPDNLSDYAKLLKDSNYLKLIGNNNNMELENKSDINYNEINSNLRDIINQIDKEFNKNIINIETINFHNSNNNNSIIKKDKDNSNEKNKNNSDKKIFRLETYNYHKNESNTEYDYLIKLNEEMNPYNLIFNFKDDNIPRNIVDYFGENFNLNNIIIMPIYDFDKLSNIKFNLNDIEMDKENVYYKIFPKVESNENKLICKKLFTETESQNYEAKKINIDFEKITRYKNLTVLQKLVILYGIFSTGNNPYIINFLLNSFYPTYCSLYSTEEMSFIAKNIMNEIGIDYEANFANIRYDVFNKDKNNHSYLCSSQTCEIGPVFYINDYSDFEYNYTVNKILNIKDINNKNEYFQIFKKLKIKNKNKNYNNFNLLNKNISIQKSILLTNVITHNPYISNIKIKKYLLKKVINYLKELCKLIKEIKNNKIIVKEYNIKINDGNNNRNNKNNNKLDKNSILKVLRENKKEFKTYSIRKYKDDLIKKNNIIKHKQENIKENILNIVNKYSEYNIKCGWENMKDPWYQKNQSLNPILRFNDIKNDYNNINNKDNIINVKNNYENEDKIKFGFILNIKTN